MNLDRGGDLIREMSGGALADNGTGSSNAERWRKLFVNIRMHLKPSPIAVRLVTADSMLCLS